MCDHLDFDAEVDVNRLSDFGAFSADVRIRCRGCSEPFVFIGSLAAGLSPSEPMVNIDGSELHVPIQPASWGRRGLVQWTGFTVRAIADVPHG